MMPIRIAGATHAFGKPDNWDEAKRGPVRVLMVRVEEARSGREFVSAWKPTLEEIQCLQDGGHILLTVCGHQPPVALHVEPADDVASEPTPS
jgi:hypothetical protein